ncbi:cell division topological specificity factor MinE [Kallotenue papyrolyticum]|uniref:cell division topological specificity factor MinE n=1 Tax=Kallotenue papyrolyticum TaxID=1325125 RepID=UPI000492E746|nr:cell division topological specificity factor MinE [Kallotenue papyrolyticum]
MSFLDTLLGRKRESSSAVAKERLLTVLVHDRVKLTPDMLEAMQREIVAVISKYVDIVDPDAIQVSLLRGEEADHLQADIPVRRSRS